MGLFSLFSKKENFNLKKSDFITEKDEEESNSELIYASEEFLKSMAEWKKKNGISKNETDNTTLLTNIANVSLLGNKVEIIYHPLEIEIDDKVFIEQVNHKLKWVSENINAITDKIIKNLLPLKNEDWLDENEPKISEREFINRIKLFSIMFFDDLSSVLEFDDGNLFWKHIIVVHLDKENKITYADIEG